VAIIEEAKKEAELPPVTKTETPAAPLLERRPSFASKAPLTRQESRPAISRRDSTTSHTSGVTPSASVESWRSHPNPLAPPSAPRPVQARPRKPSLVSSTSIFDHVDTLREDPEVELEVVDFSDFGRFMGVPDAFPCELVGSCDGAPFGVDDVGAADEGRDQPGPVVVDGWGVAVSFAVTRREEWADGGRAGRTGSSLQSQNCGEDTS
jgi:hypothetical protein